MAGTLVISKSEYNSYMARLIHDGKVIDRIEIEAVIVCDEDEISDLDGKNLEEFLDGKKNTIS